MAEELPSGVFLLTYKITAMKQEIFIIVRHAFNESRGAHLQVEVDNPVVVVFDDKSKVDDYFRRRMGKFIELGFTYDHLNYLPLPGVAEKYIVKNKNKEVVRTYIVIQEYVL